MSYVPPDPHYGPGSFGGNLDRANEEIGREEAFAAQQRLAREAEEVGGGTPMQKLWRRAKSLVRTEEPPQPPTER